MNTIDLHMHSQYSIDGEFSVKELCEQYVALTRPRYYLYVLNITIQ